MDDELYKNFPAVLEELHGKHILYSEATRKQIKTALAKVKAAQGKTSK